MKIRVLKQTENELRIEFEGGGHGICNLLQKKLLENTSVEQAGYDVPHPLAPKQVIYLRMKGKKSPKDALLKAAKEAQESNSIFGEALQAALNA
jgi:DNA-directed RNA polymerase subunit L